MVVRPKRMNLGRGDRATVTPVRIAQSQTPAESFANPLIRNILSRQPHRYARLASENAAVEKFRSTAIVEQQQVASRLEFSRTPMRNAMNGARVT